MDQNGTEFGKQLKYSITWKSFDPLGFGSTRRHLDEFEIEEDSNEEDSIEEGSNEEDSIEEGSNEEDRCDASFAATSVAYTKYIRMAASQETIQTITIKPIQCFPTPTWTATFLSGPSQGANLITLDSSTSPTKIIFGVYSLPNMAGNYSWSITATSSNSQVISYSLLVTAVDLCVSTPTVPTMQAITN